MMKITWTDFALKSLYEIYTFYKGSVNIRVANKIRTDIFSAVKQLKHQPYSGAIEMLLKSINEEYRYLIVGNYKIIYKILKTNIYITDVFDTRQNPEKIVANNSNNFTINEPTPEYQTHKKLQSSTVETVALHDIKRTTKQSCNCSDEIVDKKQHIEKNKIT